MYRPKGLRPLVLASALAACSGGGDGPAQLSESGHGAFEVSLAAADGRLTAAWYDTRDGNAEIYARDVVPEALRSQGDRRLTDTVSQSYEADIVPLGDGFAVAWYEKDESGRLTAELGIWSGEGGLANRLPVSNTVQSTRNPVLAASRGRLLVAWIEADAGGNEHVWARWLDENSVALGEPMLVARASATTWNLNAEIDADGAAHVVFDAVSGTEASEIFVSRIDDGAATTRRLTLDDGFSSKYPDIAFAGDRVALTWFDERFGNNEVFFAAFAPGSIPDDVEAEALRITSSDADSIGGYVAGNESGFGLAWSDDAAGAYDVYFQRFDLDGVPLSDPVRLSTGDAHSLIPAIQPWGSGYAVAWNEVLAGEAGYHDESTRSEIVFAIVGR